MTSDEVARQSRQNNSDLIEVQATLKQLTARADRHSLVIGVLKDMLLAQGGINEDEFLERLEAAARQKADDRKCRQCGKAMNPKHNRCIYCGEQRATELF
jgi:hypothetical protein